MEKGSGICEKQERWNEYGRTRLKEIEDNPNKFIIDVNTFPLSHRLGQQAFCEFLKILGPLREKKLIDLGCGRGELSVFCRSWEPR